MNAKEILEKFDLKTLRCADLQNANLRRANLQGADLRGADLQGAYLQDAYLQRANLRSANLRSANLRSADLQDANLRSADLQGAYLQGAYLQRANLRSANLRGANLQYADLRGANLPHFQIPQEGDLIVWGKKGGKLVKLKIPHNSKRTASLTGRKCRAEFAYVLFVEGGKPIKSKPPLGQKGVSYEVGRFVKPDKYCDDIRIECSHGIHFFLTKKEAEEFS